MSSGHSPPRPDLSPPARLHNMRYIEFDYTFMKTASVRSSLSEVHHGLLARLIVPGMANL